METQYNRKNRRKHSLKAHIVLVKKYRKKLLTGVISDDIKKIIYDISYKYNYDIIAMETDKDHVHFLVSYDTTDREHIVCGRNILCSFQGNTGKERYFGQTVILLVV